MFYRLSPLQARPVALFVALVMSVGALVLAQEDNRTFVTGYVLEGHNSTITIDLGRNDGLHEEYPKGFIYSNSSGTREYIGIFEITAFGSDSSEAHTIPNFGKVVQVGDEVSIEIPTPYQSPQTQVATSNADVSHAYTNAASYDASAHAYTPTYDATYASADAYATDNVQAAYTTNESTPQISHIPSYLQDTAVPPASTTNRSGCQSSCGSCGNCGSCGGCSSCGNSCGSCNSGSSCGGSCGCSSCGTSNSCSAQGGSCGSCASGSGPRTTYTEFSGVLDSGIPGVPSTLSDPSDYSDEGSDASTYSGDYSEYAVNTTNTAYTNTAYYQQAPSTVSNQPYTAAYSGQSTQNYGTEPTNTTYNAAGANTPVGGYDPYGTYDPLGAGYNAAGSYVGSSSANIEGYVSTTGEPFAKNWGDGWQPDYINTTPTQDGILPVNAPLPYILRVARVKSQLGFPQEGLEVLHQGLASYPNSAEIYREQGNLYRSISQWEHARGAYQTALSYAQSPDQQDELRYFLNRLNKEANWGTAAITQFEEGYALYNQGDFARANLNFAETTRLAPEWAEAYLWLGRSYQELGEMREARLMAERALNHDTDPGSDVYQGAHYLLNILP